jgi:hypothetical protein
MREFLKDFEERVGQDWKHLSVQTTSSGTRCIGQVPEVGKAAWLHRFYSGCPAAELDAVEQNIGQPIAPQWREALEYINGASLFLRKISLRGVLPGNLVRRSIEDPQPLSFQDANTIQRPSGNATAADDLVIGGSSIGSGALYLLRSDGSVLKCTRDGRQALASWETVQAMLESEYKTLAALHDAHGVYHPT